MIYKLIIEIINKIKSIGDSLFTSHIDEDLEKDLDFDKNDLYKFICVVLYKMNDEDKLKKIQEQFVEKIIKRNTVFLSKNHINLNKINYNEKIASQLIYYVNQLENIIKSEALIKKERKEKNIYAIEFCKSIIETKKIIEISNIKSTPSLKNLADSMSDKTERLIKTNNIINQKISHFFDKNKPICMIELKKSIVFSELEEEVFLRYIDYFIAEIKFGLNNKKTILEYFNVKKGNGFLVNFTKLVMFYFFIEITNVQFKNEKEINRKLLDFILILKDEIKFNKLELFNLFKSLEYINFSSKEYNSAYCNEEFWVKKDELIKKIFDKTFFNSLSKDDIVNFIKNYYAEHRKMPTVEAKVGLQQSFVNILSNFNKEIMLEIAKDYNNE